MPIVGRRLLPRLMRCLHPVLSPASSARRTTEPAVPTRTAQPTQRTTSGATAVTAAALTLAAAAVAASAPAVATAALALAARALAAAAARTASGRLHGSRRTQLPLICFG